jgi:predicted kinase
MSIKKIIREELLKEERVINFSSPTNNFVVVAGGPGAGKSFVTRNLINLDNIKNFNVDNYRVSVAKQMWGDNWKEMMGTPEGYEEILDLTHTTSDPRNLTIRFLKQFLQQERNQGVNVVYDAGGGQKEVMEDVFRIAKDSGFETTLIWVRANINVAQERNLRRDRTLPAEMVVHYHDKVKKNIKNLVGMSDNVWVVNNNEPTSLVDRKTDQIDKIK